jgi:hypothetical protein
VTANSGFDRTGAALVAVVLGAVAVACGAVAAGCGGDDDAGSGAGERRTVDAARVEQGVTQSLSTSAAKVTEATCPAGVPVQAGDTFTCSVAFSTGATGKVVVTQQGGGRYTYALKAGSVQIPGASAEAAVEASLASQGVPNATVTCPQTIAVKEGTTVTCDVGGGQGRATGTVTFTFSSAEGTIEPSSVQTG